MSYTAVWIWHIVAGLAGAIVSLTIFYQFLEKRFSIHKTLVESEVTAIFGPDGNELPKVEQEAYVASFNRWVFMGADKRRSIHQEVGVDIQIRSGETIHVVQNGSFYEVHRITKRGKSRYYRLYSE